MSQLASKHRMLVYSQSSMLVILFGVFLLFIARSYFTFVYIISSVIFLLIIIDIISTESDYGSKHKIIATVLFFLDIATTLLFSELDIDKFIDREANIIFTSFIDPENISLSVSSLIIFKYLVHILLISGSVLYPYIKDSRPKNIQIVTYTGDRFFFYVRNPKCILVDKYLEYWNIFNQKVEKMSTDLFFSIASDTSGRLMYYHLVYVWVFVWNCMGVLYVYGLSNLIDSALVRDIFRYTFILIFLPSEIFAFRHTERFLKKDLDLPDIDEL